MFTRTVSVAVLTLAIASSAAPRIDSISPSALSPSRQAQTVTVQGDGFQAGLRLDVTTPSGEFQTVQADGITAQRPTSFQASVLIDSVGKYEFVVTNPDGAKSAPYAVDVKARTADAPAISRVTPAETVKRPEAQALQVEGSRFATGLRAIVTDPAGADVTEAVVSKLTPNSFELMVKLDQTGDYSLQVSNPSGATSNVFRIVVR